MAKRTSLLSMHRKPLLRQLRELHMMLVEMNQKLDHLIQSCRRCDFTDDFFSHSSNHEFKG